MTKFAGFDPNKNPSPVMGWYDQDFHGEDYKLPTDVIPITEAQWENRKSLLWFVLDGKLVSQRDLPLPPVTLAGRLATLAALRYSYEVAGCTYTNGTATHTLPTDRVSAAKISAAYQLANSGAWIGTKPWKIDDKFVPVTAEEIKTMALRVIGHVASCYEREAELAVELEKDLNTDLTVGWPT